MSQPRLSLFTGYGVEIEYMIVQTASLDVFPIADELLRSVAGAYVADVTRDGMEWSNELATHVIEIKTHPPPPTLLPLGARFQAEVHEINRRLAPFDARLMPSAMHPWMDPFREMRLWPHDYSPIYQAYNRIFDCRGHGWSNLQSLHLNLPFADDAEFGRLHAAIRLLLPLLPGLAASSPFEEARSTGFLDTRLHHYRTNSSRIPSLTAAVIPEPIYTEADYREQIFARMYRDIAPHDPEGVLQDQFLNARGAIARFDRGSLEIRLLDTQECPAADLAVAGLICAVLRALTDESWTSTDRQGAFPTSLLADLLARVVRDGESVRISDPHYLEHFGCFNRTGITVGELWRHLADDLWEPESNEARTWRPSLDVIFTHGTLARRLLRATQNSPSRDTLAPLYRRLCDCLRDGTLFVP